MLRLPGQLNSLHISMMVAGIRGKGSTHLLVQSMYFVLMCAHRKTASWASNHFLNGFNKRM